MCLAWNDISSFEPMALQTEHSKGILAIVAEQKKSRTPEGERESPTGKGELQIRTYTVRVWKRNEMIRATNCDTTHQTDFLRSAKKRSPSPSIRDSISCYCSGKRSTERSNVITGRTGKTGNTKLEETTEKANESTALPVTRRLARLRLQAVLQKEHKNKIIV